MNRFTKQERQTAIEMWNSGVPRQHIEEFLGIGYPVSSLIKNWRSVKSIEIASREERIEAVAVWRDSTGKFGREPVQVSPWETVYAELRQKSGRAQVPALGQSRIEVVISILVDGVEVSRKTTTVLEPEHQARQGAR